MKLEFLRRLIQQQNLKLKRFPGGDYKYKSIYKVDRCWEVWKKETYVFLIWEEDLIK